MEVYLVSFDISDDGLRRRIAELLLGYGDRVQRSVFEVSVKDRRDLDQLQKALTDLVEPGDDDIRLYRLCAACRRASATLDGGPVAAFPAVLVV